MRSAWLALGMLFLVAATDADAQAPDTVVVGDRVRITTASGTLIGELVSLDVSLLQVTLSGGGTRRSLARSDVERIQLSVGRERRGAGSMFKVTGATILAGAALGALLHDETPPQRDEELCQYIELILICALTQIHTSRSTDAFIGAGFGALLGIPIGLLVGFAEREIWQDAELNTGGGARASFKVSPVLGRRVGLVGTLRFSW